MLKPMCAMMLAAALFAASFDSSAVIITPGTGSGSSSSSSSSSSGPVCNGAASQGVIWPPDHSMVAETIIGVTDDPAAGAVAITITGIQQDEPVLVNGSGNTQPDGVIQNSTTQPSIAYVRAERAGPGTGRIYFISYSATDGIGNSCTGMVQVQVPHDQGQGFTPVDTGNRYDSTVVTTD